MNKVRILCLPGWMENKIVFNRIKSLLNDEFEFFCIDFPGFDDKSYPDYAYYPIDYARYINEINLDYDYVLAHSYGGKVALENYFNYKKTNLILISPSIIMPRKTILTKIKIIKYKLLKKLNLLNKNKEYGSEDYINAKGIMKEVFKHAINTYYDDKLKNISHNVLLIYGKNDKKTPVKEGKRIKNKLKNCNFKVINGDHFTLINNEVEVAKLIYNFINKKND